MIKKELLSYLDLEENWDGYNGVIPDKEIIFSMISFFEKELSIFKKPNVMLSGCNEVCFFWRESPIYIELSFKEPSKFTSVFDDFKEPFGEDNVNISDFKNTKIYSLLNKFFLL